MSDQPDLDSTLRHVFHPHQVLKSIRDSIGSSDHIVNELQITPDALRALRFDSIINNLNSANYESALLETPRFLEVYVSFNPTEIDQLTKIDNLRKTETLELTRTIQECSILIKYDELILQQKGLSDNLRSTTNARLLLSKATLSHEEQLLSMATRSLGTIGAILLDQK